MKRTTVSAVFLVLLAGACTYPGFGGFKETPKDAGTDALEAGGGSGGSLPEAGEDVVEPDDAADAADTAEEAPSYECTEKQDCTDAGKGGACDLTKHKCVPCLPAPPAEDVCTVGTYCVPSGQSFKCTAGCKFDSECRIGDVSAMYCNIPESGTQTRSCLGCKTDDDCAVGQICDICQTGQDCDAGTWSTACVPGCRTADDAGPGRPCDQLSDTPDCCGTSCVSLIDDVNNCGVCGKKCVTDTSTATAKCGFTGCDLDCKGTGLADCNSNIADGCEVDTKTDKDNCAQCTNKCTAGQTCQNSTCQ
jgi:hypothetical protein